MQTFLLFELYRDFLSGLFKILIPLSAVILAYFLQRRHTKIKERKRIIALWEFINIWIGETINSVEEFIEKLNITIDKLNAIEKVSEIENNDLEVDINRIINMAESDLYQIFSSKRKHGNTPELNKKMFDLISKLKELDWQLNYNRTNSLKKLNKLIELIQMTGENARKVLDNENSLVIELDKKRTELQLATFDKIYVVLKAQFEPISKVATEYFNLKNSQWNESENNILKDLNLYEHSRLISKHRMDFLEDKDTVIRAFFHDILLSCDKLDNNIDSIFYNANDIKLDLEHEVKKLEEITTSLKEDKKYFEELEFKHWRYFD